MSFDSAIFLAFMFAVIAVTTYKFFSEKRPSGSAALDVGVDLPPSDYSHGHDSSHHGACDTGAAHDGGVDCGHGGFDGGSHH